HIISIDPADSKDMDDAIYVEKLENGDFFLSVSIADVSHYVKQNSELDKDALTKCTSVYLVDRVLPMLHHNLSNNLCSLNPNIERFCLTCDMVFDKTGKMISKEIYPAIMINHNRLSYDIVNEYFETKTSDLDKKTLKVLNDGFELYSIIRNKKYKEGYVDLDIKEPKVICDDEGNPVDIFFKPRGDAQKMIEDFMIACNEAVTKIADELKLPFIYRVHDKPDIIKITKLTTELKKLRFKNNIILGQEITPKDITELLENNKDSTSLDMLNILILKSMQKAQYSTNNIGHFGLASEQYTHFTSPIRRYSDLIVHRIFWMFLFDRNSYSDNERKILIDRLENDSDLCNIKEVAAVELERDVMSYKIAEYMEKFIDRTFEAKITTVTSFGFFVELENTVEGLVSINSLEDDFYTYDPEEMILIGKRTQKIYTMGMNVKVKLVAANKFTRKIDFIIEGK
ncbi:MAG: ribonuclease R, partial [Ureaplasma sp.]|nr:ribonuclease R [Ureaplasma sp.]